MSHHVVAGVASRIEAVGPGAASVGPVPAHVASVAAAMTCTALLHLGCGAVGHSVGLYPMLPLFKTIVSEVNRKPLRIQLFTEFASKETFKNFLYL